MSSKPRVVVSKAIAGELSVSAAATEYRMRRRYLHKLLARYREHGLDGLEQRSRAPLTSAHAVTERCGSGSWSCAVAFRGGDRGWAGHNRLTPTPGRAQVTAHIHNPPHPAPPPD
ncbi:helix-turn-helix domain-containing protein [Microbacterium arborescens]|uniref:helix-turn-helix domain-containing protein n=1 Tax=Microbacterium arborescens TaxID=33883 RepID=UPI003D2FDEBE